MATSLPLRVGRGYREGGGKPLILLSIVPTFHLDSHPRWLHTHGYITSQCFYFHDSCEVDLTLPICWEYFLPHYLETIFIKLQLQPYL